MGISMPDAPTQHLSTPSRQRPRPTLGFLPPLLGSLQVAALLLVAFVLWRFFNHGQLSQKLLVPVVLLSFILYFISVCVLPQSRTSVRSILFFAMLYRLIFLGTPPILSDDIDRYVWEGRIQNHGFNPYSLAPNAKELESLRDENYEHVNHAEISAIYP